MKTKNNYVAPSISERASRIRTSILAGSNVQGVDPIHGNDVGFADARTRVPANNDVNSVLNF
ncbi:MAG: hypothetical protein IKQ72_02180 [Bacteroidaceae bacterium]|jgi:hypothetical protein|nr:hypothetical protein [Bacteroidaceae bacterium]